MSQRELEQLRASLSQEQLQALDDYFRKARDEAASSGTPPNPPPGVVHDLGARPSSPPSTSQSPPVLTVPGHTATIVTAAGNSATLQTVLRTPIPSYAGPSTSLGPTSSGPSVSVERKRRKFPDVGVFNGDGSEGGQAFLSRFESAADAVGCAHDDNELRTELVCRLRGKASEWYGKLDGLYKSTFSDLKQVFLKRWERKKGAIGAVKLSSLQQRKEQDADAFLDECLTVFQEVGIAEDTELAKQYYVGGLRTDIRNATLAQLHLPLCDLAAYAAQVEHTVQRSTTGQGAAMQQQRRDRSDSSTPRKPAGEFRFNCYLCGKPGHRRSECPERQSRGPGTSGTTGGTGTGGNVKPFTTAGATASTKGKN